MSTFALAMRIASLERQMQRDEERTQRRIASLASLVTVLMHTSICWLDHQAWEVVTVNADGTVALRRVDALARAPEDDMYQHRTIDAAELLAQHLRHKEQR